MAHDEKKCSRGGKFLRSILSKEVSTPETHTQLDNLQTRSSVLASRFGHYGTFTLVKWKQIHSVTWRSDYKML